MKRTIAFCLAVVFVMGIIGASVLVSAEPSAYESEIAARVDSLSPDKTVAFKATVSTTMRGRNFILKIKVSEADETADIIMLNFNVFYDDARLINTTEKNSDNTFVAIRTELPGKQWENLIVDHGSGSINLDIGSSGAGLKKDDALVFEMSFSLKDGYDEAGIWIPFAEAQTSAFTPVFSQGDYAMARMADSERVSENLEMTLSEDGTYYIVTGIGSCTDTDLQIPDEYNGKLVKGIADSAFKDCDQIESVTLGNRVTTIGENAFEGCSGITSIDIPYYVKDIATNAFEGCSSLEEINVDEDNKNYSSTDGALTNKKETSLLLVPEGKTGSYEVPDGITTIEENAFKNSQVTEVKVPDSVKKIEDGAFNNCTDLEKVISDLDEKPSGWGDNILKDCGDAKVIFGDEEPKDRGVLGDVDGKGTVDTKDYILAKRYVLGTVQLDDAAKDRADVDRSGKVDSKDYVRIKRHVLGTFTITWPD